jgi:hypothetical protein
VYWCLYARLGAWSHRVADYIIGEAESLILDFELSRMEDWILLLQYQILQLLAARNLGKRRKKKL